MENCVLCNGKSEFIFNLNGYPIYRCTNCKTAFVGDMPESQQLEEFYSGFKYCINENNKQLILNHRFKKFYDRLKLPKNAKMLDVGGGSGYFSLAFETFGFGEATYVDLDKEACAYVKTLGISRVINDDISNLVMNNEKYDFIYSRHVIEHLPEPLVLVDKAIELLNDDGVFLLQMPNGLSFERLLDGDNLKYRKRLLKESNNFSDKQTNKILFSDKTAFDLNPPRHLWSFSKAGIEKYLSKKQNITYKIYTKSIKDELFSPFVYRMVPRRPLFVVLKLIKSFLRMVISLFFGGGAHLVVEIRKKKEKDGL